MAEDKKLTKKQLKTLEFKNKRKLQDTTEASEPPVIEKKNVPETTTTTEETTKTEDGEPVKKKRKTRRGRKGRPRQGATALSARFILFVGNLPYSCTVPDLQKVFKTSKPDLIRLRPDKGIAFLEFHPKSHKDQMNGNKKDKKDGEEEEETKEEDKVEIDGKEVSVDDSHYSSEIQKRMDIALLQNGRTIDNRKIKVELTVGGGGNSEDRREKIGKKNDKMDIERTIRMNNLKKKAAAAVANNKNKRD